MKSRIYFMFTLILLNPFLFLLGQRSFYLSYYSKSNWYNSLSSSNDMNEMRAVWLNDYAFATHQKRLETIQKIEDANLNTVFLIAPPIGENKGWSDVDDFNSMLSLAKTKGLSVHAWVCNMYRIEGKCADFTNETEREAQKDWALAILNEYDQLDGIHFDYIRYNISTLVNQTKMEAIEETLILTRNALNAQFPDKIFSTASFPLSGEIKNNDDYIPPWYNDWFNNSENNHLNRWNRTGYDYKGIPTPFRVQQDPKNWVSLNTINFTISMEYCYETSWWKGEVNIWNNWMGINVSRVYMGLGYYSKVWEDPAITPNLVAQEIVQKINYGRLNNISGFSIFEFGEPGNDDYILINALTIGPNAPFRDEGLGSNGNSGENNIDSGNNTLILVITLIIFITAFFSIAVLLGIFIVRRWKTKIHH
ncbi:MAG: hypothetical protein GF383_12440 [Candidatus Lokiarchaeota archaeon]|nr:hypothetical protein [Candidatus Lokiarchaeota archaeon]MBD3341810.1 hypothetical protein [Candidatus Lokiarchaeota archaeon]